MSNFNVEATEAMKENPNTMTHLQSLLEQTVIENYNPPLLLNSPVASYITRKTITWIEKLPKILFIVVGRREFNQNKNLTFKLFPTPTIKKKSAVRVLFSIICRTSMQGSLGHYICFFRCADKWFYFNDLGDSIVHIGTFDQLLAHPQHASKILKNSVMLMYSVGNKTEMDYFKSA